MATLESRIESASEKVLSVLTTLGRGAAHFDMNYLRAFGINEGCAVFLMALEELEAAGIVECRHSWGAVRVTLTW